VTALPRPLAEGLIGHDDLTSEQDLFHVTIAEAKLEIEPDGVADNLGGEAVVLLAIDRC
jgi:hypothetical protein